MQVELGRKQEVVVYDQSSKEAGHLSKDGFVHILMGKLEGTFHKVSLLTGMWECLEHDCDDGGAVIVMYVMCYTSLYYNSYFSVVYYLLVKQAGVSHLIPAAWFCCSSTVWSADVPDEHNKRTPPLSLVFLVVPHFELAMRRSQVYVELERRGEKYKSM